MYILACGKPLYVHLLLKRPGQDRADAIGYDEVGNNIAISDRISKNVDNSASMVLVTKPLRQDPLANC